MNENDKPMLQAVEEELERLRRIRNLLTGAPIDLPPGLYAGKRRLSPEARQRMVDAQKRRWAAEKQSGRAGR